LWYLFIISDTIRIIFSVEDVLMAKLNNLLNVITKDEVYIQMHNYPDQDAIASAFGLKTLLESGGMKATICYNGQIDKFNTLKMIELLHIDIVEDFNLTLNEMDEIILIDGQLGNVNMNHIQGKKIACIDHHPISRDYEYKFCDIRSEYGACSTIIAHYFVENKIELSKEVATALLYGIKMDTSNLTRRVSNMDIDMFSYLYKIADIDKLIQFDNCSLRREDLIAYQDAISTLRICDFVGIAKIGDDCSEAIIGTVSDFLLTLAEVKVSLVYAYRVGGLKFSVRSENKDIDAGKIIREALQGIGDGGGHYQVAAGFVPDLSDATKIIETASLVTQRVIRLVNA
jgi:nanoRNase/pAp phosphatase (c-di-AMP/oligoRNAs hydrolase)